MTKTNTSPHQDIYTRITNQIIESIEAGADAFQMPWHTNGLCAGRPINAASGKAYRGVNVLALWCAASEAGYSSEQWATYKQWSDKGVQVRKGEKSTNIVFWKINDTPGTETDSPTEGDDAGTSRRIIARGYNVFNIEQTEGYQAPAMPARPHMARVQEADEFFNALGADIRHGGARAFYRPSSDHIQMPPFEVFHNTVAYYSVLSHEVTHWTGAKARLDRDLSGRFGNESYAAEELVAELGAAFLCADLGLANEPRPDHASYVANWLKVLKDDKRAIFTAAAKAQQAVDFTHNLQPQPRGEPEPDPEEEPILSASAPGQFTLSF